MNEIEKESSASYALVKLIEMAALGSGLVGGLLGRFRGFDRLFSNWVLIGLNIPAIVVAITCYIWLLFQI